MSKRNFAQSFISEPAKKVEHSPAVAQKTTKTKEKNDIATPLPEVKSTFHADAAETKSRRVQLLLKPSDYEKLAAAAKESGVSVNRVIEELIAKAL